MRPEDFSEGAAFYCFLRIRFKYHFDVPGRPSDLDHRGGGGEGEHIYIYIYLFIYIYIYIYIYLFIYLFSDYVSIL